MKIIDWHGLYGKGWGDDIVPDAYSHPAKYARGLIRQIYRYALERGYLQVGDHVVDPFGGVALGSLDAMLLGLHWTGCELEEKFVTLGNANLDLWRGRYAPHFAGWGTARLVQGDSRQLCRVIGDAAAVVSSPPYIDSVSAMGNGIDWEKAGRLDRTKPSENRISPMTSGDMHYGLTPGQLGSMREGSYYAAISSPPYSESLQNHGAHRAKNLQGSQNGLGNYPSTDGNLGHMSACVSSPPYENSASFDNVTAGRVQVARANGVSNSQLISPIDMEKMGLRNQEYGIDPANIGNDQGETFWSAAALIVGQVYQVLKPGGYTFWVTKNFVRNKKRVPFSDQWQAFCEAHGLVPVERIRAWVVEDNGTQGNMFGDDKLLRKERKSFFRRLAEKNGSPRIDWEDVLILRKPLSAEQSTLF